jgi:hypothetical protein
MVERTRVPATLEITMLSGASATAGRAEDVLPALGTRDVLLVAPTSNAPLAQELKTMYEMLPETREAERSLVTMPADVAAFHQRIVAFFQVRLVRT